MVPMGISANQLGADLRVPANRVSEIVAGRRSVTPDTARRSSEYFGTTDRFWMNLQVAHDLSREEAEHGAEIRAGGPTPLDRSGAVREHLNGRLKRQRSATR